MGKILAIDFGQRRIGLALSDDQQIFALPRPTLEVNRWQDALVMIRQLCDEEKVERIIVGQPVSLAGVQTKRNDLDAFVAALRDASGRPIETVDERLTSRQAERELAGLPKRRAKGDIDRLSAVIILENYLECNRGR
ncbi:MAG: Holliday junction resolvase RuvX [Patescibacteria group bacterium]